ncbi:MULTISPECIES: hypothetical protein [Lactococcus]|nr:MULTISPECIES: hypothetical protein [Lactococcus]MCB6851748.1 hypothetical protein [Lactococcus lactis]MDT2593652.1 hypothetical protein [Lactococcus petauri]MDU6581118.1 hypothetical protein [Lactococcus lactis]
MKEEIQRIVELSKDVLNDIDLARVESASCDATNYDDGTKRISIQIDVKK